MELCAAVFRRNHPDEHILQGLLSMLTDSSTPADMVGGVITSLGTEIKVLTEEEPVAAPPLPAQASSSSTGKNAAWSSKMVC